jgi:hypothetical protein
MLVHLYKFWNKQQKFKLDVCMNVGDDSLDQMAVNKKKTGKVFHLWKERIIEIYYTRIIIENRCIFYEIFVLFLHLEKF